MLIKTDGHGTMDQTQNYESVPDITSVTSNRENMKNYINLVVLTSNGHSSEQTLLILAKHANPQTELTTPSKPE